jgi:hypothetical protein
VPGDILTFTKPVISSAPRKYEVISSSGEDEGEEEEEEEERMALRNRRPKPAVTSLVHSSFELTSDAKNMARQDAEASPAHRICRTCLQELSLGSYHKNTKAYLGRLPDCSECSNSSQRRRYAERKKRKELVGTNKEEDKVEEQEEAEQDEEEHDEEEMGTNLESHMPVGHKKDVYHLNKARYEMTPHATKKFCSSCLIDKDLEDYCVHPNSYFGRQSICKSCRRTSGRVKRKKKGNGVRQEEDDDEKEQHNEGDEMPKEEEEAPKDENKGDGGSSAASRASTATDRNRKRRDRVPRYSDMPKPTSKWCGGCLRDLSFSSYAKKKGGFAIFGRAAQCDDCINDVEVGLQAAVRYTHASHCQSIARATQPTLRIKLSHAYIVCFLQTPTVGAAGGTWGRGKGGGSGGGGGGGNRGGGK